MWLGAFFLGVTCVCVFVYVIVLVQEKCLFCFFCDSGCWVLVIVLHLETWLKLNCSCESMGIISACMYVFCALVRSKRLIL
jgi:hypothetical protein